MKQPVTDKIIFSPLSKRQVEASFTGGTITSDGGGLLLKHIEYKFGFIKQFSQCFTDYRDTEKIEHTLLTLLRQRIFGIALGYEDVNDHDTLRNDPLLATMVEVDDPTGQSRLRERDKGKALASKSTLNRLELADPAKVEKDRYKKITYDQEKIDRYFIDQFVTTQTQIPDEIILDLDATDDPLHGNQEGRFFHGYYMHYCYLPLYIFCGHSLLCARLRTADCDAAAGSTQEIERIVNQIRQHWPDVRIIIRGDSGFCREELMAWCEHNNVDYVLGLAKNARLKRKVARAMELARQKYLKTEKAARVFIDFPYKTLKSWSRKRRVIGKAEYLHKGENPRFIVTSLSSKHISPKALYEKTYCARGDMENRIKEQQLSLFADRTSCTKMRANQLRLWFSAVAYQFFECIRRFGLVNTIMHKAQVDTIRLKLLKIGAVVRISVRRVVIALSSAYPYKHIFNTVMKNLKQCQILRC
jgi:hypothetical protein